MSPEQWQTAQHGLVDEILQPALRVGLGTAGIGFLIGGTSGILRERAPVVSGIASSIKCGTLGAAYWATRTWLLIRTEDHEAVSPADLTKASGIAGGVAGSFAGLVFRGPRNVLPGLVCISLLATSGQFVLNYWNRERPVLQNKPSILESISQSSWSPVQSLTDKQYADILREKLLKVEVEIAVLDDKIAALQVQSSDSRDSKDER